jgi:hypothetical protein
LVEEIKVMKTIAIYFLMRRNKIVIAGGLRRRLDIVISLLHQRAGLPAGRQGFCNLNVEIIFPDEIRRHSQ